MFSNWTVIDFSNAHFVYFNTHDSEVDNRQRHSAVPLYSYKLQTHNRNSDNKHGKIIVKGHW